MAELRDFLMATPFFGGLVDEQLDGVIRLLKERTFPAGSAVFREREQGRSMYIVHSGELIMTQASESGRAVKLMRLKSGDFFGETTLIEIAPRSFTVLVEREARLWEITNMDLYKLCQADIKAYVMVLQNINRELCRRLRRGQQRITEIADSFDDPETTQLGHMNIKKD